MNNVFKVGDKVRYKDEGNNGDIFIVYGIYSNTEVSLCLRGYPDTEQDYLTNINDILKI
jgi:hypothetical protein